MGKTRIEKVVDEIRNRIQAGKYKPHERIASEVKLQEEFKVSGDTIRKSLGRLINEGLIYRLPWKGTFVSPVAKVGRILVVTNFATRTIPDDFGILYGFSAFEHSLRCYESEHALPYALVIMDSDTYVRCAHEIHLVHKDIAGIIFFRRFQPLLTTKLLLEDSGIPYLFYGAGKWCRGHMAGGNTYCYEEEDLISSALEYLVSQGHERILCLQGQDFAARYHLYEEWMRKHGLWSKTLARLKIMDNELMMDPVQLPKLGTAILGTSDRQAVTGLNELVRAGIQVPGDIAVMGIDNYPICRNSVVPLTSVDIPLAKDAARCLELFVDFIEGRRKSISAVSKVSVVVRESA
jgi:DNA-binding LacI/PurR family transcriptional regulator